MAVMTGTDFAQQLAQIRPDLPVILITGYPGTLTREKVRAMGIRELLLKPLEIHLLGTVIQRVLTETTRN